MTTLAAAYKGFAERRLALLEQLRSRPQGYDWCSLQTALVDELVTTAANEVLSGHPLAPPIAVVATGGYGRRELAPYSDIDITIIPLEDAAPGLDAAIKDLYRALHHAIAEVLHVEAGYAYTLINDAPGLDEKSRTGLLDARFVAGSEEPLEAFNELFWDTFPPADFLIAKLQEREAAHAKTNDTPLVVEPHLKEGAGGLRSFQAANWIRAAIGERPLRRSRAYTSMLQLRNLLQLCYGKKQDLLTRPKQGEIAELVRRDLYSVMAECAANGVELHRQYVLARERIQESRFTMGAGVEALRGEARILPNATLSEAASGIAKAGSLNLRVPERQVAASSKVDGAEALVAISAGEEALRNLDHCGLLEQLLPELTRCRTLMPMDSAHTFTVFEHTFRAIRALDQLPQESFLGSIKASLRDLGPLWLALLLHDTGKAVHEKPHSETGADIAAEVAGRWRLTPPVTSLVQWLVREHLSMARFIQMRDIHQPATVAEFAQIVGNPERLTMLTLLTACDIQAVSIDLWNPAQEDNLRELYLRTMHHLEGNSPEVADVRALRKNLLRAVEKGVAEPESMERFLEGMPAHYITSTPPDMVRLHLSYVRQAADGQPTVQLEAVPSLQLTRLTVCAPDKPGLLSNVLGVVYAYDLGVHNIRASTFSGEASKGSSVALDSFDISFGGRALPAATAAQLSTALRDVLNGKVTSESVVRDKGKDPTRAQETFSYSFHEGAPSILEVQAPKGRGMAYRLSRFITNHQWNITAARVGQWAGRGAAAFYLQGNDGAPISRSEVDRAFRDYPLGRV